MKDKLKKKLENFFFKNKFGKWLFGSMAILNGIEGIIHLIVAGIGTAGVMKAFGFFALKSLLFLSGWGAGLTMWAIMLPNIENLIFGLFSIAVGFALGIAHHHHHHGENGEHHHKD